MVAIRRYRGVTDRHLSRDVGMYARGLPELFLHNLQSFLVKGCADSCDLHSSFRGTMVSTLFTFVLGAFLLVDLLLLRILTKANPRNRLVRNSFFEQRLQLGTIFSLAHFVVCAEFSRI